jgi:hypothetical protein
MLLVAFQHQLGMIHATVKVKVPEGFEPGYISRDILLQLTLVRPEIPTNLGTLWQSLGTGLTRLSDWLHLL